MPELDWLPADSQFVFEDCVHWQGKGSGQCFPAARVDTIVLGPHASMAFPEEIRPFVSPELTRRLQGDYSDVATMAVGCAWAACDPNVVFISCPHSRAVLDTNRSHSADPEPDLRRCFALVAQARTKGEPVSLNDTADRAYLMRPDAAGPSCSAADSLVTAYSPARRSVCPPPPTLPSRTV